MGPEKGALRCARREASVLTCGLLRDWTAKLQWPILLTTACDESNDGAEHRHVCDLFGHGSIPAFSIHAADNSQIPVGIPRSESSAVCAPRDVIFITGSVVA